MRPTRAHSFYVRFSSVVGFSAVVSAVRVLLKPALRSVQKGLLLPPQARLIHDAPVLCETLVPSPKAAFLGQPAGDAQLWLVRQAPGSVEYRILSGRIGRLAHAA